MATKKLKIDDSKARIRIKDGTNAALKTLPSADRTVSDDFYPSTAMSESRFDTRNGLRSQSQNSKGTYVGGGVNQRNATSIASPDDIHTNSKPLTFEAFSNETFALDKYLTRLHTNLDSRYQWPSTVVAELRKPRPSDPLKPGISTVRRLSFNPYPLGTKRLCDELSAHIGIQPKSTKLHASDWRKFQYRGLSWIWTI